MSRYDNYFVLADIFRLVFKKSKQDIIEYYNIYQQERFLNLVDNLKQLHQSVMHSSIKWI